MKIRFALALLLGSLVAQAQTPPSPFFVKVTLGPAMPAAELTGNAEDIRTAAYAKTGTYFGLTVGREFTRWFGVSASVFGWTNPVNNQKLTELTQANYTDAFNQVLANFPGRPANLPPLPAVTWSADAEAWRFLGAYVSPFVVGRLGERFAVEGRLNAGLVNAAYPAITAEGTGTGFLASVLTNRLRGNGFLYGGGIGLRFRVQDAFHLVANLDALRARPRFPASTVEARGSWMLPLNGQPTPIPLLLDQPRDAFSQTIGTLAATFGVGIFF